MAKFKRRPNKSGTVVKLSGTRSNPYMAKITIGYSDIDGSQIQKPLGYYESREDALNALALYNLSKKQNVNDQQLQQMGGDLYKTISNFNTVSIPTFKDIYQIILSNDLSHLTKSRLSAYDAALKRLSSLHEKSINVISLFEMQACIDTARKEVGSKVLFDIKTLCTKVFEYAVIHQYIKRDQDFTGYLNASKKEIKEAKHKPFSLEEIKLLQDDNSLEAKICLIYILTGCRPIELIDSREDNLHLDVEENGYTVSYIIAGAKTVAGKNRVIPIHDTIKPYINDMMKVIRNFDSTASFRNICFNPIMAKLKMTHTPYDTRHTFASLAKLNSVDDFCRKRIMGHKSNDITDDTYTHTFTFKLFEEINKIKMP